QHFHADHPVFSCSKSEQKQLNTWVSFQSAEQPLLGQFSVSGNTAFSDPDRRDKKLRGATCGGATSFVKPVESSRTPKKSRYA
ncbi:hypothetical protein Q6A51_13090, partial [Pseudomonas sp. KFB-139]